jgi:hypothetical protein
MKWISRHNWHSVAFGMVSALLIVPSNIAESAQIHPYRHSDVDMPVSISVGAVRTPEFLVTAGWYDIMIQVQDPLPAQQMRCMMGVTTGPLDSKNCSSSDPLLRADWKVWDGDHVVDRGSIPERCACKFDKDGIFKFLGSFRADAGKRYVVEVIFTKDGTPLNVADPHLIVIQQGRN